jgi:hypothetical protein
MAHGLDHPSNFFGFACLCGSCRCSFESVAYLGLVLTWRISPFPLTLIVIAREPLAGGGERVQRSDFKVAFASKPVERQTRI